MNAGLFSSVCARLGLSASRSSTAMAPCALQIARADRLVIAGVTDDDVAETLLQILERGGEAEDRHDLRGDHDVEAVLARIAVARSAEAHGDVAQCAVVHVDHALPGDAPHVDAELVAVVDVVIDQCRQQVVGQRDGIEVAGEVQVDVFHRHHLRVAAAGRAAFHAEYRTQRGLAQADAGLLADPVQRIAETDRGGGLAFAGRRRGDGGDEDQLAVGFVGKAVDVIQRDLGLVVAVGIEELIVDAELALCNLGDSLEFGLLGDLDIGCHVVGTCAGMPIVKIGESTRQTG